MNLTRHRTTVGSVLTILVCTVGLLTAAGCSGQENPGAEGAKRTARVGVRNPTQAPSSTASTTSVSTPLFPTPTPISLDDVRIPRIHDIVPVVLDGPLDQGTLRESITFQAPAGWEGQTNLSTDGSGSGPGSVYAYAAASDDGSATRSVVITAGTSCGGDRTINAADGTPWTVETAADGTVLAHTRPIDGCWTIALHGFSPTEATDAISRTDSAELSMTTASDTTLTSRAPSWLPPDLRPHWRLVGWQQPRSIRQGLIGGSGRFYSIVRSTESVSPAIELLAVPPTDVDRGPLDAIRCERQGPTTVCASVSNDGSLVLSASRDGARIDISTSNADAAAGASDALARMGEILNHLSP